MTKTLFIVNPHAGNGRGQRTWEQIEPIVVDSRQDYMALTTNYPEDVPKSIREAADWGADRIISVGGDGTNYVVINALQQFMNKNPDYVPIYGTIPAGTGRDWARGAGLPLDTAAAIRYVLYEAQPRLLDLGFVRFGMCERYFFNISSVGISNDIVRRVESGTKYPWTFMFATVNSLLSYKPIAMRVTVDETVWYEGNIYIATVANNSTFGQGMRIAPDASMDDGLLDVVVVEEMALPRLLRAFPSLYSGQHVNHPKIHLTRGRTVRIETQDEREIGMDLDGEIEAGTHRFDYRVQPQALRVLL